MNAIWRQMRRLIVHPEAPPFIMHLTEVFRVDQQLFNAHEGIAGILIDDAPSIAEGECQGQDDPQASLHDSAPSEPVSTHVLRVRFLGLIVVIGCSGSELKEKKNLSEKK